MKAAQMGVTEVAINRAFYTIDILHRDVLYVLPTATTASDFSKARFGGALIESDYLRSIFTDTNTVGLKQAGGICLYIRGSRGDSNLKSIPVSELILDEVDEMDQKQIWLALERLSGKLEKHICAISTPTIPKKGIHKLFLDSTQEEYKFQCPRCGRWTELIWPDCIEIHGESVRDPKCRDSRLICKECKGVLEQQLKPEWLDTAEWVATVPQNPDNRGFHINQLYSFTVTPGDIVIANFRGQGDEAANVEFHNSKLGIPFVPEGGQVSEEALDRCLREHTKSDPRPVDSSRLITMGIDQGKWNYVEITEYFFDEWGRDLNVAATAKVLWEGMFTENEWHRADQLMREWQVLHCVVDADPQINEARRFSRRFPGYVTLCRYRRGIAGKEISIQDDETDAPIATVDRTNWLDAALGRFHVPDRILLPRDVSQTYKDHIMSQARTYEKDDLGNPRAIYTETGPDHFSHARTYSEIALPLAASKTTHQDISKFL